MDGILEGAAPPKSCTSVTVTIDKIVVALGEGCTTGSVTGSTTTTTSESPGNKTTTTRMTVTINDVMPQEIETTRETEVGNKIGNKGDVGIETSEAAGEAGRMAVQLSDRRRREKEKKRKYRERKKERDMAVDSVMCSGCIDQATKRAVYNRTYVVQEHVKERRAENERNKCHSTKAARQATKKERDMAVDSVMCSNCIDPATKHAENNPTYQAQEHVKERHAKSKRHRRHSTKAAQQAADVDGIIKATKKKRADKFCDYDYSKYMQEHGAESLRGGRAEVDGDCCDNCRRKNFSSNPRYALEFKVVPNTEIQANTLAKVKPKNRHTPVMPYSLCQECVRFFKKPDNYAVMTACQKDKMLDWKKSWPSFMWDLLSSSHN
jgi:hypothetical protein